MLGERGGGGVLLGFVGGCFLTCCFVFFLTVLMCVVFFCVSTVRRKD